MVTIIDYGVGNLGSIKNMFLKIGIQFQVTSEPQKIQEATKILLPGVGAFDAAMSKLNQAALSPILKEKAAAGVPLMGICLGAQLLTEGSEEGVLPGLGLFAARCVKFKFENAGWKIPHMGWNELILKQTHSVLDFPSGDELPRFYFAHSFHFQTNDPTLVAGVSNYSYDFPSALAKQNVVAVQFHPEKSHKFGMRLLENFGKWNYEKN